MVKLGDAAHAVLQPIVDNVIDPLFGTSFASCGGCDNRRRTLNDFSDAVYDVFWNRAKNKHKEKPSE